MKRYLTMFLAVIMLATLMGCSSGGSRCSVKLNDGTTTELTVKEIINIKNTDTIKWENFQGANISGTGKITKIAEGCDGFYYVTVSHVSNGTEYIYPYYQVTIDDNLIVLTRQEVFSGASVGDKVRFDGSIGSGRSTMYLYVDFGDDSDDVPMPHIFKIS